MSSRVLRDDLWTSERVNALHDKTFRLYLCLFNAADDYGLVEIGFGDIRRAAPLMSWTREEVAKMLGELVDAGVIRPYEMLNKPYAAIERWRPFIRSGRPRYPIPSFGMGHVRMPYGFKDRRTRSAASLILIHLPIESAPLGDPEDDPGESLGSIGSGGEGFGGKGSNEKTPHSSSEPLAPTPCPQQEIVALWIKTLPGLRPPRSWGAERQQHLAARWRELMADAEFTDKASGLQWFGWFFDFIGKSPFLTGKVPGINGKPPFTASLDWVVLPRNFAKIIDRNYHSQKAHS